MRLGFIGTGTITTAVVTGLCRTDQPPTTILVSPRNADRAAALQNKFDRVAIARDNQDLVNNSDWVVLAILPQAAQTILSSLTFRVDQRVLSLIATLSVDDLANLVAPVSDIFRVVPLPTAVQHLGPIAIYPSDPEVAELMNKIGSVVEVENESQFYALWSVTSLMAPYFALLGTTTEWLISEGVSKTTARQYVGSMFRNLSTFGTEIRSDDFDCLVSEHQTPGGLNEQALKELTRGNWYASVKELLKIIRDRLQGNSTYNSDDQ
jgi:pyrroline-5-carboxylate reductase